MCTTTRSADRGTATEEPAEEPATPPTTTRRADEATKEDSQALTSWPHGWKHAGSVTALAIDRSKVNKETLGDLIKTTKHHLGGEVVTKKGEHLAVIETNLCGHITVALTKHPSRCETFKDLGCRVYFRGVQRKQQDLGTVIAWMGEMKRLTRSLSGQARHLQA